MVLGSDSVSKNVWTPVPMDFLGLSVTAYGGGEAMCTDTAVREPWWTTPCCMYRSNDAALCILSPRVLVLVVVTELRLTDQKC